MSPDAELNDIAGGDPQRAQILRRGLERLQDGAAGPALQEMARDVLAGRISLRTATAFNYYQDALTRPLERFQQWRTQSSREAVTEAIDAAETASREDSRR